MLRSCLYLRKKNNKVFDFSMQRLQETEKDIKSERKQGCLWAVTNLDDRHLKICCLVIFTLCYEKSSLCSKTYYLYRFFL